MSCSFVCSSIIECKAFSISGKTNLCQLYKKGPKTSSVSIEPDRRVYYVRVQTTDQPNDKSNHSTGRLLFAFPSSRSSVSQLTLGQNVPIVSKYLFLRPLLLRDLQYSYSLQRLFIAQCRPNTMFSTPVQRRKKSVIRNSLYCKLSVDGGNGVLFASANSEIHRMTTQGRLFKRVHRARGFMYIGTLTIDPQHKLVYAILYSYKGHKYDVISLKYSGDDVDVLIKHIKGSIYFAEFNQKSQTLLFAERNKLISYDPPTRTQKHSVLTTVDRIRGMTSYRGTLYFVDGNSLMEFDYKTGKKKALVDLPRIGNHNYRLCVID